MRKNQAGVTLIELLIVMALVILVTGAIFALTFQGQRTFQSESQLNEATRQARVAMDQIIRYLRQAGNAPQGPLGVAPIVPLGNGRIQINSDITGSVPSSTTDLRERTGDPNGLLDSIHEIVEIQFDQNSRQVLMDIGYGEDLLVAENISALNFTFFDLAGVETANPASIVRAEVEMVAQTGDPMMTSGKISSITFQSNVFLRSKAFNFFPAPAP